MSKQTWHPASEPPDTDRVVLLRCDHKDGPSASIFIGRYNVCGRFERRINRKIPSGQWQDSFVWPDWWRELTEQGKVSRTSARTQLKEIKQAGYLRGESAGHTCTDCSKNCGKGWWIRVSYEYNEWECWCRECAYDRIHRWDNFKEEE